MSKTLSVPSRQKTESFTISSALLGIGASVNSDIVKSAGYAQVQILIRSDRAFTVRVLEAITNPSGGPTFVQTATQLSAADPLTGEQVVFTTAQVHGSYMRIRVDNTSGAVQTAFQPSATLLPIAGSGSGGAAAAAEGACGTVFCYLTFS